MALEIERKYLLASSPDFSHPALQSADRSEIEQIYLVAPEGEEVRIRRRARTDRVLYYRTRKYPVRPGVREEDEQEITAGEYEELKRDADPDRQPILKDRLVFDWEGQQFELDDIRQPESRACFLLEIELSSEGQAVSLPPFLDIAEDVTSNKHYSNAVIAKG